MERAPACQVSAVLGQANHPAHAHLLPVLAQVLLQPGVAIRVVRHPLACEQAGDWQADERGRVSGSEF
jgi:hypothetical protein